MQIQLPKLDILAIAAHPDDAELACSGTLLAHKAMGHKVGILDLTRGEMGTRGTPEIRKAESIAATAILGVDVRHNLDLGDITFGNTFANQLKIIEIIRAYQPSIVLINALDDRHIDHGKGGDLANDACFISGLAKIETTFNNKIQTAYRPKAVYQYIQDRYIKPDIIFDITPYWSTKLEAIKAFKSQFYDPQSQEPVSYISTPQFWHFIEARALEYGHSIGVQYGEGFTTRRIVGTNNLFNLV